MVRNSTSDTDSPNPLTKLPVINRLKVVKDFILGKLDLIEYKLNTLFENELTNDAQLLEGVTSLTQGITELMQEIENIHHKVEWLYRQEAEKLCHPYQTPKYKIVVASDTDPETGLMIYLYSFLTNRKAVDIGANIGDISAKLLEAGYEVYAFEPFPKAFESLKQRFLDVEQFHSYPIAVGSVDETREFHIAQDHTEESRYKDSTLFNSLTKHAMPNEITFVDSIQVPVRSLESLHQNHEIPADVGIVKIDVEGFDLEVLKGMGSYRYPVVVAEFWDAKLPFALSGAFNRLEEMVNEMRGKGYHWYVVIYRVWGNEDVSFYCNYPKSVEKSWGNVFFFQECEIFSQALKWCLSVLEMTYIQ